MTAPARPIVEVGFTGSPSTGAYWHIGDAVRGRIGTAAIGPDEVWTDITERVVSVSTRRGATRADGPILRYESGTATILLNNHDRRFDPTNLGGPYVVAGVSQVEPMRAVRIRAEWDGVTYPIWRGYADAWQVDYQGPTGSTVTLTASDAFSVFASYDRVASVPVGAGELSGARIGRVLTSAGWPTEDRVIAAGDSTMQETDLEGNALSELQLVAESEIGELYVDASGRVVFRNRRAVLTEARSSAVQTVFGNDESSLVEVPYADVGLSYDAQSITNYVSAARAGGTAQIREDATSRARYLTRSYTRSDLLLETDSEAASYAGFVLHQGKNPELRFNQLTLLPRKDARLWPQALGREIGDRIQVIRRPPGGGDPIIREVFVRGIEHDVRDMQWTTRFALQSATRYQFWTIGHPSLGQVGVNAIAF
jgi:ribosomal protein L14